MYVITHKTTGQLNRDSRWDSKCIDQHGHADQGISFPLMHNCIHMSLIILTLAYKAVN